MDLGDWSSSCSGLTEEKLFGIGILALSESLHTCVTGSGELDWDIQCVYATYLRKRLGNWSPSHPDTLKYDESVKALVTIALDEWERERAHG
jgi:hypothetical protein